ncbi:MAG TPA: STAS domain-containing protein [Vicinamibacterales bacterium]|nr:STAS domain-containing protein [Vicinamibacterales bacterium]
MAQSEPVSLFSIITRHEKALLADWVGRQLAATTLRRDLISDVALREQSAEFLALFRRALEPGETTDVFGPEWQGLRDFLGAISRQRARQGFTPTETATFIFSLKEPLFERVQADLGSNVQALSAMLWRLTALLDRLGLYTAEVFQKGREEVLARHQRDMLELSTPVVQLWDGILALPLIGTLDSARTQVVMESLLQQIVQTGAGIAIIDITGVPTVDTLVAQHLLKTVAAARLMGADCIISGIRPQIAQTIVHLGVELGQVTTKATLADAFRIALRRNGQTVTRIGAPRETDGHSA